MDRSGVGGKRQYAWAGIYSATRAPALPLSATLAAVERAKAFAVQSRENQYEAASGLLHALVVLRDDLDGILLRESPACRIPGRGRGRERPTPFADRLRGELGVNLQEVVCT
jgi:hypothetical protein